MTSCPKGLNGEDAGRFQAPVKDTVAGGVDRAAPGRVKADLEPRERVVGDGTEYGAAPLLPAVREVQGVGGVRQAATGGFVEGQFLEALPSRERGEPPLPVGARRDGREGGRAGPEERRQARADHVRRRAEELALINRDKFPEVNIIKKV